MPDSRTFGIAVLLLLTAASTVKAQDSPPQPAAPGWTTQVATLGANSLLSGVSAGLMQHLRGGSFQDGFTRGAMGGALIYTGKRIAVERFDGAGFIGREVGAVGASVVRNAADGIGSFERVVLPVGPVRLYVSTTDRFRVQPRIDVSAAAWLTYAVLEPELKLHWGDSFSAGTPVFRTENKMIVQGASNPDETNDSRFQALGVAPSGLIFRSYIPAYGNKVLDRTFAHERVHVLQSDQIFLTLTDPGEDWLLNKSGATRAFGKVFDLNLSLHAMALVRPLFSEYRSRPWEVEASYLTR